MKVKKKKTSLLTRNEIFNLKQIEWALNQNEEETISQACIRYSDLLEEYVLSPSQTAHESFCKDNPQLDSETFYTWCNELIEDSNLFRLDKTMLDAVKEAKVVFDTKIEEWIEEGLVSLNYDTSFAFWGIIGLVLYNYFNYVDEKKSALANDAFFRNPMFGKYKITALDYADEGSLKDFKNPHGYDRFNIEAILFYIIERYDAFYKYQEYRDIYNEVKNIVYEDPDCKLSDTKRKLELLAKSSSDKKFQYALLYACAVIEWYLKHH